MNDLPKYEHTDLPTKVGKPWEGNREETVVNFWGRCERITTNVDLCDRCLAQMKNPEIENVEAD